MHRKLLAIVCFSLVATSALASTPSAPNLPKVRERLVGLKSGPMEQFIQFTANHPQVLRFALSLYKGTADCVSRRGETPARWLMFPSRFAQAADNLGRLLLDSQLKPHTMQADEVFDFRPCANCDRTDIVFVNGAWGAHAVIGTESPQYIVNGTSYTIPTAEAEIHELGHVERMKVNDELNFTPRQYQLIMALELGTTLEEIITNDSIYKAVSGSDPDSEIKYVQDFPGNEKNLNPGELANVFRALIAEAGQAESAVMSPAGMAFIDRYFDDSTCP